MTAEIAILNREAVALAADSAVTVRYEAAEKVFTSANKVFALSKHHPVGIMVYGAALFMNLPWETLVKEYRRHLGVKSFSKLDDYANDFLEWMRKTKVLVTVQAEERLIRGSVRGYFTHILKEVTERVDERTAEGETLDDNDSRDVVDEVVERHYAIWKKAESILKPPPRATLRIGSRVGPLADKLRKLVFEKVPISSQAKRKLAQIARWIFLRSAPEVYPEFRSGVVLAGFGDEELYPHLRAYHIQGRVNEVLHCELCHKSDIGEAGNAIIVPFAQQDVVYTFIEGINPSYEQRLLSDFSRILSATPDVVVEQVKELSKKRAKVISDQVKAAIGEQFKKYVQDLRGFRRAKFVDPMLQIVNVLPKDELAAMAEALVNLTSVKRRLSPESETVGGPIDVAIISKGDGLVWTKRKHYFPQELNHHFFANYYRGGPNAEREETK